MEILKVCNVNKIYGNNIVTKAVDNVSFTIEEGEFLGIMGPSGSGKTTLLNMISTIDKPSSGEIYLKDKNIHKEKGDNLAKFRRSELGFVFQDYNLIDTLTIKENIILPLTLDGISVEKQNERLENVAQILGIEKVLNKRTFEVSGGQAQRAAVARAIIHKPSLLLADEPTGNLDSASSKDVMELFSKINKEGNVTTMMVTHDPVAASFCNRILFIKDGKIYNEIYNGGSKEKFYQEILDVLSMVGGNRNGI